MLPFIVSKLGHFIKPSLGIRANGEDQNKHTRICRETSLLTRWKVYESIKLYVSSGRSEHAQTDQKLLRVHIALNCCFLIRIKCLITCSFVHFTGRPAKLCILRSTSLHLKRKGLMRTVSKICASLVMFYLGFINFPLIFLLFVSKIQKGISE